MSLDILRGVYTAPRQWCVSSPKTHSESGLSSYTMNLTNLSLNCYKEAIFMELFHRAHYS